MQARCKAPVQPRVSAEEERGREAVDDQGTLLHLLPEQWLRVCFPEHLALARSAQELLDAKEPLLPVR